MRVFLLVLGSLAPLASAWGIELQQLLGQLAQKRQGHATFVETRYLAILAEPIKSSGTLSFQSPARIEKITLEPKRESLVLDGDNLSAERGGKTMSVDLKSHRQVLSFVEAIRGVLMGDIVLLQQEYRIELSGNEDRWNMILVPQDRQLAEAVKEIRIGGGGGQVRSVEYLQRDGDRSVMQITPDAEGGGK
jgi:outer membrane lipoprotein-sorting protein